MMLDAPVTTIIARSDQTLGKGIRNRNTTAAIVTSCPMQATQRSFISQDALTMNRFDGLGMSIQFVNLICCCVWVEMTVYIEDRMRLDL